MNANNNNNKNNKNYDINEKENFSKERKEQRERWENVSQKRMVENKNPRNFYEKNVHSIPVNQNVGKKLSSESMKGRVFEANIGDLNSGYEANTKVKLIVEDADGKSRISLSNFYGLEWSTWGYLCSLIRKWHTLIDLFVDCKTNDGFLMRFLVVVLLASSLWFKNNNKILIYFSF